MAIEEAFIMQRARQLYWQGYPPAEIARLMGINQNTVYSWKKRDEWDATPPIQRVTTSIDARLIQLTTKDKKTGGDFKEIDLLTRQLKKLDNGTTATQPKKKIRKKQNYFSESQIAALRENILGSLHWHQRGWYDNHHWRNRMILKSRQVGATWYFAREALVRALSDDVKYKHQRNQIFLSASRRQAYQFRSFIRSAAAEVDVELKGGDMIQLFNGAELHFLGTSAATAQSYTGNLYFDEFFWVGQFANLKKVAGAMATLKGLTRTYFSTPSAESHEAYPFWTGEAFNKGRSHGKRVEFDTSWKTLNSGLMCPDKIWRQIVTLQDAIDHGWDLTDIDEIRDENSPVCRDAVVLRLFLDRPAQSAALVVHRQVFKRRDQYAIDREVRRNEGRHVANAFLRNNQLTGQHFGVRVGLAHGVNSREITGSQQVACQDHHVIRIALVPFIHKAVFRVIDRSAEVAVGTFRNDFVIFIA